MVFGLSRAIRKAEKNAIIAELKVYSPKYGDLLKGRNPFEILRAYERAGAVGISYITDPKYFREALSSSGNSAGKRNCQFCGRTS